MRHDLEYLVGDTVWDCDLDPLPPNYSIDIASGDTWIVSLRFTVPVMFCNLDAYFPGTKIGLRAAVRYAWAHSQGLVKCAFL